MTDVYAPLPRRRFGNPGYKRPWDVSTEPVLEGVGIPLAPAWELRARRKVRVPRRQVPIIRLPPRRVYAFAYSVTADVDDRGRSLYDFECLDEAWMLSYYNNVLEPRQRELLDNLFGGRDSDTGFDAVYAILMQKGNEGVQQELFEMHRDFGRRMLDANDPAPVSLLHVIGPPRPAIVPACWYSITIAQNGIRFSGLPDLEAMPNWTAVHQVLAMAAESDPLPLWRLPVAIDFAYGNDHILKMLHLPQVAVAVAEMEL
jgi:hypothetical protein